MVVVWGGGCTMDAEMKVSSDEVSKLLKVPSVKPCIGENVALCARSPTRAYTRRS